MIGRQLINGVGTMSIKHGRIVEISCSFCSGSGKDPFGIMSSLSTCCVCKGRGFVLIQEPYTPCAHCRATGAINTLTCTVCGGIGFVPKVPGLEKTCPVCRGTGDDTSAPAMACLRCRGRGWILLNRDRSETHNLTGQLT
jgi:DnaJ-class molecular chaperone